MNLKFCISLCLTCILCSSCNEFENTSSKTKTEAEGKKKKIKNGVIKSTSANDYTTEINYVDNVKNGSAKMYYPDGTLYKNSNYKEGKLHGLSEVFRRDGSIERSTEYKNGKQHGDYKEYFKSGKVKTQIAYKNDIPLPGIFRKDYLGKESPAPKIIMRRLENYEGNPFRYRVEFSLSEEFKETLFIAVENATFLYDSAGTYERMSPHFTPLNPDGGNYGYIDHYVPYGNILKEEYEVYAIFKLKNGKAACVKKDVSYAFLNNG